MTPSSWTRPSTVSGLSPSSLSSILGFLHAAGLVERCAKQGLPAESHQFLFSPGLPPSCPCPPQNFSRCCSCLHHALPVGSHKQTLGRELHAILLAQLVCAGDLSVGHTGGVPCLCDAAGAHLAIMPSTRPPATRPAAKNWMLGAACPSAKPPSSAANSTLMTSPPAPEAPLGTASRRVHMPIQEPMPEPTAAVRHGLTLDLTPCTRHQEHNSLASWEHTQEAFCRKLETGAHRRICQRAPGWTRTRTPARRSTGRRSWWCPRSRPA